MYKNQLKEELAKAHEKLNNLKSISEDDKSSLRKIMNDISRVIENSDEKNNEDDKNLLDELKESISKFEIQNPELSESINIIVQTLSNLGI